MPKTWVWCLRFSVKGGRFEKAGRWICGSTVMWEAVVGIDGEDAMMWSSLVTKKARDQPKISTKATSIYNRVTS